MRPGRRAPAAWATIAECSEAIGEDGVWGLQGAGDREIGSTENENELVETRGYVGGGVKGVSRNDKLYRECSSETVVGRRALSLAKRSESGEKPDGGPAEGSSAICSCGI